MVEYELRALRPADAIGNIKSGEDRFKALSLFARKKAKKFEAEHLARTYVLEGDGRLQAYVTLVCSEVASEDPLVAADDLDYHLDTYPAVKIARLLVDHRARGGSLGRSLVEFALGLARTEICPAIGCRFVVVDAKKDSVGFYEKQGFTMVDTEDNRGRDAPVMFIDLFKATA